MSIAITLCTRGRPQMLRRCLESLPAAIAKVDEQVHVIVVENDIIEHSRSVVESMSDVLNLHYVLETESGIPFARNRSVEEALKLNVDWLIFIDDDEWVPEGWLQTITTERTRWDAEVVTGPVHKEYPENMPGWLPRSNDHLQSGETKRSAATNNTMVSARLFRKDGLDMRFDERMRFTGGSDSELFLRFTRMGGRIVWIREAAVFEEYPISRSTLKWHINRNIRTASGGVFIERLQGKPAVRYAIPKILHCLYVATGRLLKAGIFALLRKRSSYDTLIRSLLILASAWGYARGLMYLKSNPYLKIEGH